MAKSSSAGEYTHHTTAIRNRIVGSGNFRMTLHSLDSEFTQTLVPVPMQTTTSREPTRLANFNSQRTQLEFKTTEFDEYFKVTRMIIFMKPVETGDFPA